MANIVYPDKRAVLSGSTKFAYVFVKVYGAEKVKVNGYTFVGGRQLSKCFCIPSE